MGKWEIKNWLPSKWQNLLNCIRWKAPFSASIQLKRPFVIVCLLCFVLVFGRIGSLIIWSAQWRIELSTYWCFVRVYNNNNNNNNRNRRFYLDVNKYKNQKNKFLVISKLQNKRFCITKCLFVGYCFVRLAWPVRWHYVMLHVRQNVNINCTTL